MDISGKTLYVIAGVFTVSALVVGYFRITKQEQKDIKQNTGIERNRIEIKQSEEEIQKLKNQIIEIARSSRNFENDESKETLFFELIKEKYGFSASELEAVLVNAKKQSKDNILKALAYYVSKDYNKALQLFRETLNNSKIQKDRALAYAYAGNILSNSSNINDLDAAEGYLYESQKIFSNPNYSFESIDVLKERNNILFDLGYILKTKGNKQKALNLYKEIIHNLESINNKTKYDLLDLGRTYHSIYVLESDYAGGKGSEENIGNAYKYKKLAFEQDKSFAPEYLNSINSQISYYKGIANFSKAKFYFTEGISTFDKLSARYRKSSLKEISYIYSNYALTLQNLYLKNTEDTQVSNESDRKVIKRAIEFHVKAIDFYELVEEDNNARHMKAYGNNLNNLGRAYSIDNNIDEAILYYKKASELREKLFDSIKSPIYEIDLAHSLVSIAMIYSRTGNPDAKTYAKNAKEIYFRNSEKFPYLEKWIDECNKILKGS